MANIDNIPSFILKNIVPVQTVGTSNNINPSAQLVGNTYPVDGNLKNFNFIDGNNDNQLSDHEKTGTYNTDTRGDRIVYDGQTYYVQSMWVGQITVTFSDGHTISSAGNVRIFVIGQFGSPTQTTGDVIVNPLDGLRDEIRAYLAGNPGIKFPTFTVDNIQSSTRLDYTTMDAQDNPICFASGTMIETKSGMIPVEQLRAGDAVRTQDHGFQHIRWIGAKRVSSAKMRANPKLCPIRIRAGALGQGLPARDLTVSRQHRILVRSSIANLMFGADEILVPAIKLVGLEGIEIVGQASAVTYWHLLFDQHEVIFAEGTPTESLFTGPEALRSLSPEAREEIIALLPELLQAGFTATPARQIPDGRRLSKLISRHAEKDQPLLSL